MKISVAGTGYVGLVTGVCLAEIGHDVICYDVDKVKIEQLKSGHLPIYEPLLEESIERNIRAKRLHFTSSPLEAYTQAEIVYIAVGTPEKIDGAANLDYVNSAAKEIATYVQKDVIVVTKSTVPFGTNKQLKELMNAHKRYPIKVDVASNPEFLREGSAVHDTFHGDRIVIGAESEEVASVIEKINEPFKIPIIKTSIESAEMIKYAANAFLAMKITFVNEIANLCEYIGADIQDVANGIGTDQRIGKKFLRAGIGYGGSCFPKDTHALLHLSHNFNYPFSILESVIHVNHHQQMRLYEKAKSMALSFFQKKVVVLGLTFKPNTDDIREAPSLRMIEVLLEEGAVVTVYDPAAMKAVEQIFGDRLTYAKSALEAIEGVDAVFIVTEWDEIKEISFSSYLLRMKQPLIFDGRNCYQVEQAKKYPVTYVSIGREDVICATLSNTYTIQSAP
ncbi:UDP-glucose/GDP-mannose dehydrogenase family protein [Priestia megaterium]|nr:UDP-glucose/GDP-mannose dehydrogenase family protein [Priestia megaterium]